MRYLLLLPLLWALPVQANNESQCQREFVDWMLHQQQLFSDRKSDKMARRRAERAIDMARQELDKQAGFCKTMQLVRDYKDGDPRFISRPGELHDYRTAAGSASG
ncbi:MAG: hypothetical protein ACRC91_10535 [Aeromonas sp.]